MARWRGRLGESAAGLARALDDLADVSKALRRLHAYASLSADLDTRVAERHALREEIEMLFPEVATRTAYVVPEILALPRGNVEAYLREEKALAPHAQVLRTVLRRRDHHLGLREEELLAEAGLLAGGPAAIFGLLHNADLPRARVRLSTGESVRLGAAAYALHRGSPVRRDREKVVQRYLGGFARFERTLGQNLFECVKERLFRARARRYASCLEAALDPHAVPVGVYRNLLEQAQRMLPLMHRYLALRGRALGVAPLEYHDLHAPVAPAEPRSFTTAAARRAVRRALAPLGSGYLATVDRAFEGRWIDWHPTPGKRAGAYANGSAYDVHPYLLLNYNGDLESVSTLAHEMGHAIHSRLSNLARPFPESDYAIFVAEVASTFNEILLHEDLLRRARGRAERLILTARALDELRSTFFRQAMFAEFELAIHGKVERGEALTGRTLSGEYLSLLRRWHGHDRDVVRIRDLCGIEWATVPHFYYGFYVYQYATGIAAAITIAEQVLAGRRRARGRYLSFLRSGASDDPLVLLRRAGVDLEGAGPYEAVGRAFALHLDRLEAALDDVRTRRPLPRA